MQTKNIFTGNDLKTFIPIFSRRSCIAFRRISLSCEVSPRNLLTGKKAELILASESKGKAYVLSQAGIKFIARPANINEENFRADTIADLVKILAFEKAKKIKEQSKTGLILSDDTLVVLDDQAIGKPKDSDDAIAILQKLSGRCHQVVSGVTLWDAEKDLYQQKVVFSEVYFRKLNLLEITSYVATKEPFGKAGAYGVQGGAGEFIEKIIGDPSNVLGLSLQALFELLTAMGWGLGEAN